MKKSWNTEDCQDATICEPALTSYTMFAARLVLSVLTRLRLNENKPSLARRHRDGGTWRPHLALRLHRKHGRRDKLGRGLVHTQHVPLHLEGHRRLGGSEARQRNQRRVALLHIRRHKDVRVVRPHRQNKARLLHSKPVTVHLRLLNAEAAPQRPHRTRVERARPNGAVEGALPPVRAGVQQTLVVVRRHACVAKHVGRQSVRQTRDLRQPVVGRRLRVVKALAVPQTVHERVQLHVVVGRGRLELAVVGVVVDHTRVAEHLACTQHRDAVVRDLVQVDAVHSVVRLDLRETLDVVVVPPAHSLHLDRGVELELVRVVAGCLLALLREAERRRDGVAPRHLVVGLDVLLQPVSAVADVLALLARVVHVRLVDAAHGPELLGPVGQLTHRVVDAELQAVLVRRSRVLLHDRLRQVRVVDPRVHRVALVHVDDGRPALRNEGVVRLSLELRVLQTPVLLEVDILRGRDHHRELEADLLSLLHARHTAGVRLHRAVLEHADAAALAVRPRLGDGRRGGGVKGHAGLPQVAVALQVQAQPGTRGADPHTVLAVPEPGPVPLDGEGTRRTREVLQETAAPPQAQPVHRVVGEVRDAQHEVHAAGRVGLADEVDCVVEVAGGVDGGGDGHLIVVRRRHPRQTHVALLRHARLPLVAALLRAVEHVERHGRRQHRRRRLREDHAHGRVGVRGGRRKHALLVHAQRLVRQLRLEADGARLRHNRRERVRHRGGLLVVRRVQPGQTRPPPPLAVAAVLEHRTRHHKRDVDGDRRGRRRKVHVRGARVRVSLRRLRHLRRHPQTLHVARLQRLLQRHRASPVVEPVGAHAVQSGGSDAAAVRRALQGVEGHGGDGVGRVLLGDRRDLEGVDLTRLRRSGEALQLAARLRQPEGGNVRVATQGLRAVFADEHNACGRETLLHESGALRLVGRLLDVREGREVRARLVLHVGRSRGRVPPLLGHTLRLRKVLHVPREPAAVKLARLERHVVQVVRARAVRGVEGNVALGGGRRVKDGAQRGGDVRLPIHHDDVLCLPFAVVPPPRKHGDHGLLAGRLQAHVDGKPVVAEGRAPPVAVVLHRRPSCVGRARVVHRQEPRNQGEAAHCWCTCQQSTMKYRYCSF
eukprot:Rhum_TRINITY_DN2004_c0_g1::Rhum_TRINITY_DN2004_c0_g1_i1::g.5415::m.5415